MIKDKMFGCLYGQAIGDALGPGSEFMSKEEVLKNYPGGLKNVVMKTIFDRDTNIVYLSDKLEVFFNDFYKRLIKKLDEMEIPFGIIHGTKDIWCRDYMPIQIQEGAFVGYDYNPDYLNDESAYRHTPRLRHLRGKDLRSDQKEVWKRNAFPYELKESGLVLDGGNVVICDKYIILTDKIYKENRFGKEGRAALDEKIADCFNGLIPVIIPWKPVGDDVFGHSDGMVKYQNRHWDYKPYALISPMSKKDSDNLYNALGKEFYLDVIEVPEELRAPGFYKYSWAYINYLQVGRKILIPVFNLPSDCYVIEQIQQYNPDCVVEGIEMREIAECGGALHCITWNIRQ